MQNIRSNRVDIVLIEAMLNQNRKFVATQSNNMIALPDCLP